MIALLRSFRHFGRDVHLLFVATALIGFTVFGGVYTVLLNLYLLRLGYGPQFVGQVNAAGALSFALFSLPAGLVGNRWGNRRVLIAGMALAASGYLLFPLAEFIPHSGQQAWLLGANAFGVLGMSMYLVNSAPFLTARTEPHQRRYVFSAMVALWPLAGFAGSLIGGFLPGLFAAALELDNAHPAAYRYPLLLAASLLLIAVLALLSTDRSATAETRGTLPTGSRLPYGVIGVACLVTLLQMTAESGARTFFNVYMDDELHVPVPLIGALSAAGQILAAGTALAAPRLGTRFGTHGTITWGSAGMVICLLPLALVPHWGAAGLGCMGLIAMGSVRRPLFILFQQELVAARWRVTINSALTASFGVSTAAVALGGGYLIAALGYRALFLLTAGLTAAGTLVFWIYFRTPRGEYARQD